MKISPTLCFAIFLILFPPFVDAQNGIASKYLRDVGIATNPAVIIVEDFEQGSLDNILARWTSVRNRNGMSLVADSPSSSNGNHSLQITRLDGNNDTGGSLWMRLDRINKDNDNTLYLRYYIKYDKVITEEQNGETIVLSGSQHHTGGGIGGITHDCNWPWGRAGIRPTGYVIPGGVCPSASNNNLAILDNRFSVRAELHGGDQIDFYNYWMGMRKNNTTTPYYGNRFIADPDLTFKREVWTCIELMVKLNTAQNNGTYSNNGELKLWVDGKLASQLSEGNPIGKWLHSTFLPKYEEGYLYSGYQYYTEHFPWSMAQIEDLPFEGFKWRDHPSLTLNYLSLAYYTTKDSPGYQSRIWYDHMVLATEYIGPINTSNATITKPNPPQNVTIESSN